MIIKFEIKKIDMHIVCTPSFYHSWNFQNFIWIIQDIFEILELHTYNFGLVYILTVYQELEIFFLHM